MTPPMKNRVEVRRMAWGRAARGAEFVEEKGYAALEKGEEGGCGVVEDIVAEIGDISFVDLEVEFLGGDLQ